ncbi:MAG: D-alanyl-D-alanine carboxypeptidase/D-alanyl-D-alanine endopeptidase [Phycisphaerales bacterium]
MNRTRALPAVLALAVLALAPVAALAQALERQVNDLITKSKLGPVNLGICIVDCTTGDRLTTIQEKQAFMPASNLKILTAGTALMVLGKDFEFTTRFVRDGDRLVVVGSGDPAFAEPELLKEMGVTVGGLLDKIADNIKRTAQPGTVFSEVVIDDRVFDKDGTHVTWPKDQLDEWYCAPVSGVNFHANLLEIYCAAAARPGPSPAPRSEPSASWIELASALPTVATGANSIAIMRDPVNPTRFRVQGSIRATPAEPVNITLRDAPTMLGRLIADRLVTRGLSRPGSVPAVRYAGPEEVFSAREPLAVVSTPLTRVLKRCNSDSYNLFADALLKRVGHDVTGQPGSWSNGAAVVRMTLSDKIGQDTGELTLADGSGLSRENRVSPLTMALFLRAIEQAPGLGDVFEASLAHVGEGTFKDRFKPGRRKLSNEVAGKSGYIRGVQCLSGYLTHPSTKRRVAFAILVNDVGRAPGGNVKEFHEGVVQLIDGWLSANPGTTKRQVGG